MQPRPIPNVQFMTTSTTRNRPQGPPPTIAAAYRNHSRFARIRLTYPGTPQSWRTRLTRRSLPDGIPEPDQPYTPARALQLLASTGELPASRHDLIVVLTHYRYAIRHLANQALSTRPADTHGTQPCP
jgi:hypothetical protein